MTTTIEAKVNTPCKAYRSMADYWPLIDDLMEGTEAMQDNCSEYLPKFAKEEQKNYQNRVKNSFLFGAYSDTANNISGKPFTKPIDLQGELPKQLQNIADNTDGQGKSLIQLGKDIMLGFVNRGLSHIFVDYPVTLDETGNTPNLKQERDRGYKPLFIHVKVDNLIGWRVDNIAGMPVLSQIRIKETQIEPDGQWGEKEVNYVRVIERDNWYLFKESESDDSKGEYFLDKQGVNSLGKIPLVTGYANQRGFMTAKPPLMELAETNLAHYKSQSDQNNILHYVRAPTLFAKGFDNGDAIALGPTQLITNTNTNSDVKWVEHGGTGIEAGRQDLRDLEDKMIMLGLQPLLRRTGNQTATGQSIDEARATSDIQAWVMTVEYMFYHAYELAAEWTKQQLPEDFNAKIDSDFALWTRSAQDVVNLLNMRDRGDLSRETLWAETKRRGLLSETFDAAAEKGRLETEGLALGMIGKDDFGSLDVNDEEQTLGVTEKGDDEAV